MTSPIISTTRATYLSPGAITTTSTATAAVSSVHQFKVDSQANAVNYQDQGTAKSVAASSAQLTLEPDATYKITAEGSINKGSGVMVSPTDPQRGRPDRTRLQVQIQRPDGSIESRNYTPGMEIKTGGGAGEVPAGSKLSTVFVDGKNGGEIRDNRGSFQVKVEEKELKSVTVNQTVIQGPIDTSSNTGVVPPRIDPSPTAGNTGVVPPWDRQRPDAQRALELKKDGVIATSGGSAFEPKGNDGLVLHNADGSSTSFDFKEGKIIESDGTVAKLDDATKNAVYNLPDGTQMRFTTDPAGNITGYNIQSGDEMAKVRLGDWGCFGRNAPTTSFTPDTRDGRAEALAFRKANASDPNALQLHQVGFGEGAGNKETGWYVARGQQGYGWLEGGIDAKGNLVNTVDTRAPAYVTSPNRPQLGTQGCQDALTNQLNNDLGAASAYFRRAGLDPSTADRMARQYLAPERAQYQQAASWNDFVRNHPEAKDWFGGWGNYFSSGPQAMSAVSAMYALLAQQQSLSITPPQIYA
ncbi:MAG: hypothetical protein U1E65_13140 [Myxococcota bacterium]